MFDKGLVDVASFDYMATALSMMMRSL
jgi:hypothetical protein